MDTTPLSLPLIALLGGSFNPPHAGHFRIAIEVHEALSPFCTVFLPCANPPHKNADSLLPFDLRVELLREALEEAGFDESFIVSEVENERSGPSYTADTLAILAERHPRNRLAFIMGGEDYTLLPSWKNWRDLPRLADLVVLPRATRGREAFLATTRALWPEARPTQTPFPAVTDSFVLPDGARLLFLPQPQLEISSSLVRERWLQKRNLTFFVPRSVQRLLDTHARTIKDTW